ncbi:GGDEF-domain containing protein [Oscillospiraceae bacterium]|uniref:putative bifunctional diguanylate cyclase/phosphodiesterase n=1 Tax=Allofournierella sp. TaxID=1940256 RepID=UPI0015A80F22|nr:GGDEF-domain containing protein [Oscillospiraceae bacterium]
MRKKHELLGYTSMWLVAVLVLIALLAQSVGDARIVNYSGIVRGATQKLVKEELNGQRDDALILRLDGIIDNLQTGRGEYQLNKSYSGAFQTELAELKSLWSDMKTEIDRVRVGEAGGQVLFEMSQRHFELADRMVMSAEEYADTKLIVSISFYLAVLLFSVVIYLTVGRRGRAAVEKSLYSDHLTGILNRAGFEAAADELLRRQPGGEYCLLEFDVDDFKFLNSTYGYELGNELLCALAGALSAAYHGAELCARLDADDFVVLAKRTGREQKTLLELLAQALRTPQLAGVGEFVSFTTGGYEAPAGERVQTMMDKVSLAHTSAKAAGRGCTAWYDARLLERIQQESQMNNRMARALEGGEFRLYLQPKYRLDNLEMYGAEALVRWDYPGRGLVYPDEFIPLFEGSGSIVKLDFYMLEQACIYLRQHIDSGGADFVVSVNFSRVTLYTQGFFAAVLDIVDKYRLPHRCVELEVTESAFNGIVEPVVDKLTALQQKGFSVSMDDFGAGYSSLNLLDKLPIQVLKLDKEFLRENSREERVKHVIAHVVELAHDLGIAVVCEGVETREQMEFLRAAGCDRAQGYYFSRPVPSEALQVPKKQAEKV